MPSSPTMGGLSAERGPSGMELPGESGFLGMSGGDYSAMTPSR